MRPVPVPRAGEDWGEERAGERGTASGAWASGGSAEEGADGPEFPLEALPSHVRSFVAQVAKAVRVPHDLPGVLAIGAMSSALAGKVAVDLGGGRVEPVVVNAACGMNSGTGKGPCAELVLEPLYKLQRNLPGLRAEVQAKAEQLRDAFASAKEDQAVLDAAEAVRAFQPFADMVLGVPQTLFLDDVTPEALVLALEESRGRMTVMSPEGAPIAEELMGHGGRGGRGVLEVVLRGYSHEGFYGKRISRRVAPVAKPALTLILLVQPDVLQTAAQDRYLRRRGFVGRVLWALPAEDARPRYWSDATVPEPLRWRWGLLMLAALLLPHEDEPLRVPIQDEALELYKTYHDEVADRLAGAGDLCWCAEEATKTRDRTPRLATLLHVFATLDGFFSDVIEAFPSATADEIQACFLARVLGEDAGLEPITPDAMRAAILITRYSLHHLQLVLQEAGPTRPGPQALKVLNWIRREQVREFERRECSRGTHLNGEIFERAIRELVRLGLVEEQGRPKRKPRWVVVEEDGL